MHYNTDQLRDYLFDLLDEAQTADITAHLQACAQCRAELEDIEQQFAALDVLKEQPEASHQLIESVMHARPERMLSMRTAAILALAASVALVFALLQPGKPSKDSRLADIEHQEQIDTPVLTSDRTTQRSSLQLAQADADKVDVIAAPAAPEPALAALRAQKPFAPASNIELNVLPRRDDVQLTIYNAEDLTLVRETRMLTLKRGWNWLQFMWSNTLIDPTSLSLEPQTHADEVEISQLVYPPRLNELARWTIFSDFSGQAQFELTYFTSGLKWNAFYEATLSPDELSMHLKSYVRVDNSSGEDYENAETRLVVGEINLEEKIAELAQRPAYRPEPAVLGSAMDGDTRRTWDMKEEGQVDVFFGLGLSDISDNVMYDFSYAKEIVKQALSEYQLYTIEGRETIPDGWGKRLPSFDVQEIGVTNLYKYDEERWGRNTMRLVSFANTDACALGETPLPPGRVRVYRTVDADSRLTYVGASDIKYIPVGEKVELELGMAQTVTVEPKLMRTRTDHYEFQMDIPGDDDDNGPVNGDIAGWDEITDWRLELTNTRDLPVEVEITRATGSTSWEINTDAAYEKYDADHVRFTVQLEPRSKQEILYELTVRHGTRKEAKSDD